MMARFLSRRSVQSALLGVAAFVVASASVLSSLQAQEASDLGKRLALIIGNSQYREAPVLPNTVNDAVDISAALTTLGFEVTQLVDAGRDQFQNNLDDFARKAIDADVVLFYYAGHAVQIAGRNLLIPVDSRLRSEQDLYDYSHTLSEITKALEQSTATRIYILDACRDNPFEGAGNPDLTSIVSGAGLARVGDAAGSMFIYATQPGNVALDGEGRNSPFATAFLAQLSTGDGDISAMMIEVRKAVIAETQGRQVPWDNSSLTEQFFFKPSIQITSAEVTEAALWEVINLHDDPRLIEAYLTRFPSGRYVDQARSLIGDLNIKTATQRVNYADASAIQLSVATTTESNDEERVLWDLARDGRNAPLLDIYLSRYPDGQFAQEARALLLKLRPPQSQLSDASLLCRRLAMHPRDATTEALGVEASVLRQDPLPAINACRRAVAESVETPLYSALLARALFVSGRKEEAIGLFESASERGDGRSMFSLGLMYSAGDVLPKNDVLAARYYERAAAAGNTDAMVNLAVARFRGTGIPRDTDQALKMFEAASLRGVSQASFNLASLFEAGAGGTKARAAAIYVRAGEQGYLPGFQKAAAMYDKGAGVDVDTERAADLLIEGIALGSTQVTDAIKESPGAWSAGTRRALQTKLSAYGYYLGAIDGQIGPAGRAALERLRLEGRPQ